MPATVQTEARQGLSSRRALLLLSLAQLLAMSLWFTGTAVIPQITALWHSGLALGSWLTVAVQIGFSVGAITFALFNIPDVFSPIKVLVVSAVAVMLFSSSSVLRWAWDDPTRRLQQCRHGVPDDPHQRRMEREGAVQL